MRDMDPKRELLLHFLAALAYRTQKALRGAPEEFAVYEAGNLIRTPKDLIRHMTSVLGYARTHFIGGSFQGDPLPTMHEEIARFHDMLEDLAHHLRSGTPLTGTTPEQMLQGPFADAMTHAGQIAMLRRLSGHPVPPENFIVANINADNLSAQQADPTSPDDWWPERDHTADPDSVDRMGFGPPPQD